MSLNITLGFDTYVSLAASTGLAKNQLTRLSKHTQFPSKVDSSHNSQALAHVRYSLTVMAASSIIYSPMAHIQGGSYSSNYANLPPPPLWEALL